MSEEEQINNTDQNQTENDEFSESETTSNLQEDFEQNGLLLKIATNGIAVQDYVKRLKESDILVAIDGEVFLDGPVKLIEKFSLEEGDQAKWLLTFWRDGELFDILLTSPIQSQFGLATEQETQWALEQFSRHVFGEFSAYENFEIYRDPQGVCDILSLQKDPLAFILPAFWCLEIPFIPTARGDFSGLHGYIFYKYIFVFDNIYNSFTIYI